jgi:integrase
MPVATIGKTHVNTALRPLWLRSPDLARRAQAAVLRVIRYAKASGLTATSASAIREDLAHLIPVVNGSKHPFKALDYADIPAFVRELRAAQAQGASLSASVLEFIVLTACRLNEAVGMQWSEIDWEERVWTLPAARSKTNTVHRVPLCNRALELLSRQHEGGEQTENIWPSRDGAGAISGKAVYKYLVQTMGVKATVHGFRATFRTWAGNETHFNRVTCELALGHAAGDKVELSYRRGDELDKRRALMEAWSAYCGGNRSGL